MEPQPGMTTAAPGFDPARLIHEHQAGVWRYLRVLGCTADEASDLTQETFLSVLQHPFVECNASATAGFLRTTAHNLWISYRRRSGRVEFVSNTDALHADWVRLAGEDQGQALLTALGECFALLTERARLALDLRYRKRQSRASIASQLEITEHGAKNLMQRAKQQLRNCIEGKLK